jgi:hypothetical protein
MRPNSQLKHRKPHSDKSRLPVIESNYQVATLPNFNGDCAPHELPSFRSISGEYFRNEARNDFQLEMAAFTAMILTAAIPILSNLHALADFLRAIGSL